MAETSAFKVAKVILHLAGERNISITNLKLQKLLYYSHFAPRISGCSSRGVARDLPRASL